MYQFYNYIPIFYFASLVGDCQDALNYFHPASGIYAINIAPLTQPFDVYCDMDGSYGWTVIQVTIPLVDPGGAVGAPPPQQDPFLSFAHTFLLKSVRIGGWRPPPTGNPGSATAYRLWFHYSNERLIM